MATRQLYFRLMGLSVLLALLALRDVSSESSLLKILGKRDVADAGGNHAPSKAAIAVTPSKAAIAVTPSKAAIAVTPSKASIAVTPSKAKEFLAKLSRSKRNVWDRSRPDVQQWIRQFMYMGFDEQRLEADLAYWMDHARANDQGRQHHYDENAAIAPRHASDHRHGSDANYDYY